MLESKPRTRRRWITWSLILGSVLLIGVAVNETLHWWRHVDEPNARVVADYTLLSSSVDAKIDQVHVRIGDRVERGALLASMETAVAELDVATVDAELAKERANRKLIEAELVQYRSEVDDRIVTASAAVRLQKREHATLINRRKIAQGNVDRNAKLAKSRAITARQLEDATDRFLEVTSRLRALETAIETDQKKIQELKGARKKEAVYLSRIETTDRTIDKIAVQLRQLKQRLKDMHIYAPVDALIDEIYINPGVYVEDGDRAFLLHDPDLLWIEAQVDETDIPQVGPGQAVDVEFDAYPFEYFEGRVRAVSRATLGSITGGANDAPDPRVAQRVLVVIDLPPMEKPVWPGMRATVNIVVR